MKTKHTVNKKEYDYIDISKKQIIAGWIIIPLYLWIIRYVLLEPMFRYMFGDNSNIVYIAGPIKSVIILVAVLFIFKSNIILFAKDLVKNGLKDCMRWIGKSMLIYFGFYFIYGIVSSILRIFFKDSIGILANAQPFNQSYLDTIKMLFPTIALVFTIIVAPILEEFIFRYVVYHTCMQINKYFAIFMSAIFFSILHVINEMSNGQVLPVLYYGSTYFVMAIALAVIYEKRRNLFFCIVIHMINNILSNLL